MCEFHKVNLEVQRVSDELVGGGVTFLGGRITGKAHQLKKKKKFHPIPQMRLRESRRTKQKSSGTLNTSNIYFSMRFMSQTLLLQVH